MSDKPAWRCVRYFALLDERTIAHVDDCGDHWHWSVSRDGRYVTSGEMSDREAAMRAAGEAVGRG